MATAVVGMIGGGFASSSNWVRISTNSNKMTMTTTTKSMRINNGRRIICCVSSSSSSSSVSDPYRTLGIRPGASQSEIKKAFRQLALLYHPDVCKGSNCGVEFHCINEAYDIVMSKFRGGDSTTSEMEMNEPYDAGVDEPTWMNDHPEWDMWEEWMGWEGAGIRDYSSHINPYI